MGFQIDNEEITPGRLAYIKQLRKPFKQMRIAHLLGNGLTMGEICTECNCPPKMVRQVIEILEAYGIAVEEPL